MSWHSSFTFDFCFNFNFNSEFSTTTAITTFPLAPSFLINFQAFRYEGNKAIRSFQEVSLKTKAFKFNRSYLNTLLNPPPPLLFFFIQYLLLSSNISFLKQKPIQTSTQTINKTFQTYINPISTTAILSSNFINFFTTSQLYSSIYLLRSIKIN